VRTARARLLQGLAVMLAAVAGVAIGIALVILLETRDARADEVALPAEFQAAEQTYRTEGPEAALPEFERLLAQYRASGDARAEAGAIRFIGEIHWRLGDFEPAERYLLEALAATAAIDDRAQQAKVLNVLGLLNWDLGRYDPALQRFGQAGELAAEIGDARLQGAVLNNIGLVRDELGEYDVSLDTYREALARYEAVDFPRGRGDTLGNIGGLQLLLGHYREALAYYEQAMAISEQLQSVTAMSQDHGNIALCQLGLGDTAAALEHFDRAIELAAQAGSQQDGAFWTRGKANALIRQGRHSDGLALHRAAVEQYQALGARTEAVEAMYDLGRLYLALGDSTSAEQWFERSIALGREIGLARGVTLNLLALGDLQQRRQALEQAAALYGQAWQRAQESGEMNLATDSLLRLAHVHQAQGRYEEAAQEAQQALDIAQQIDSPYGTAAAQYQLGELDRLQSRGADAVPHYLAALEALPPVPDPELGWRIHYGRGLALADQGELPAAIAELQQAIEYIEGVRDRLEEQRFRAGYVQDKYQVYVDLVRLQMQAGAAADAFSTAERLRARTYLDLIDGNAPQPLAATEQQQATELRERIRQLRKVLNEESGLPTGQQRQPAISVYSAELLAAEQAYEALLDNRRRAPGAGAQAAQGPSHESVRQRLGAGEALVEYVVSERELVIFILTREDLQAVTRPLGEADLRSKVELLRDLLRRPDSDRWQRPAASLAEALIEPLRAAGALDSLQHLYLVPHGSLNYLPFAMLPAGSQAGGQTLEHADTLLVERVTLAYLPTAAALLGDALAPRGRESLLAMAPARARLQHAPDEASRVFELFGAESRLLVGEAATESLFKDVAGDFDVLHLATHGYFNKLNPLLSGLELEADGQNDGLLELHEIIGLDLDADLVTLSACQTGLGSGHFAEIPAGDDFVGLTRAFLYAGSDAVMATLWEVDDASTAELMQQFYTRLRLADGPIDKAGALAEAQRRLRATEEYRHPYYWAPFVLMGANRPPPGQTLGA
jgi:CHAT domain-containing protein/Tfp pilus assembly protein PilF